MYVPELAFISSLALALFFGGTPVLAGSIYLAISGSLSLWLVFFLALAMTLMWDIIWYAIGHHALSIQQVQGWQWYKRREERIVPIIKLYRRHQFVMLFLSRFVYGTSTACAVLAGVFRMSFVIYVVIRIVSETAQVAILVLLSLVIHSNVGTLSFPQTLGIAFLMAIIVMAGMRFGGQRLLDRYAAAEDETRS